MNTSDDMVERESIGMIRIRISTKEKVKQLGLYGDTYDSIIERLANSEIKRQGVTQ